jgi:hypothetical protein
MTSGAEIARQVEDRAGGRCEYCRMHQALQGATFHLEHVVPQSRGGSFELTNLAWSCPNCNLKKSNRTEAVDPQTGKTVALFNPRADAWAEHFRLNGYEIVGQSPIGRATAAVLDLNQARRIMIRQAEELFSLFPP